MAPITIDSDQHDNYTAPNFTITPTIERIHDVIRFSKPSNITYFFSGTSEEQIDYVLGVAVVSMVLFSICLVWTCSLCVIKRRVRRGKDKFRWATGMLLKPKPPNDTENTSAPQQEVPTKDSDVNLEDYKMSIINTNKQNSNNDNNYEKKKRTTTTSQTKIDWEMKSLIKSLNQNDLDEINNDDDDDDDTPIEDDEKKYILEIDYGSDESNDYAEKTTLGDNNHSAVASTAPGLINEAKSGSNGNKSNVGGERFERRKASSFVVPAADRKGTDKTQRRSSSIFGIEPRSSSNSLFGNDDATNNNASNGAERRASSSSFVGDGTERRRSSTSLSNSFVVGDDAKGNNDKSNAVRDVTTEQRQQRQRRASFANSFVIGDDDNNAGNETKNTVEKNNNDYDDALAKVTKTLLYARIVFLICGVGTIMAILYSVLVENEEFLKSLRINEDILKTILKSIDNVLSQIDSFAKNSEYVQNSKFLFQDIQSSWCTQMTSIESDLVYDRDMTTLKSMVDNFTVGVNSLQSSMDGDAAMIRVAFVSFREKIVDALDNLHLLFLALDVYAYSSLAQAGLSVVMMMGVVYAWKTGSSRFATALSFWVFPSFVFVVFVSVVSCVAFVSGAIATADYCSPSPNRHTIPLLDYLDIDNAPMFLKMMDWYVQGCTGPRDILNIDAYIPVVEHAIVTGNNFMDGFTKLNIERLDRLCGGGTKFPTTLVNATLGSINHLERGLEEMKKWFSCATINSIYTSIAYDEVCYKIINILETICLLQLAIVFGSMIMITLRVAWTQLETIEEEDEDDESVKSVESVDDIKKPLRVHSSVYS